jgi:hypothetical protein
VFIWYDPFTVNQEEAIEAAYRSGQIPPNAAIVVLPEQCKNEEEWDRVVVEYEERQRQQRQTPAGTNSAG